MCHSGAVPILFASDSLLCRKIMKFLSDYPPFLMVCAVAASASFISAQPGFANPVVEEIGAAQDVSNTSATQLGTPQAIEGIDPALNRSERELPTFRIQDESKQSRGILDALGGRFVTEDRHPSFRESTLPQ